MSPTDQVEVEKHTQNSRMLLCLWDSFYERTEIKCTVLTSRKNTALEKIRGLALGTVNTLANYDGSSILAFNSQ